MVEGQARAALREIGGRLSVSGRRCSLPCPDVARALDACRTPAIAGEGTIDVRRGLDAIDWCGYWPIAPSHEGC